MKRIVVACGLLLAALSGATCSRPVSPFQVTIIAVTNSRPPAPYDYVAPSSVPAGPTLFRFVNAGTRLHELRLFRLRRGISEDSGQVLLVHGRLADSLMDPAGAVLIAPAHTTAPQEVLAYLKVGELYALMCQLRDSAGAPTHDRLGEFAFLEVRAGK